VVERAEVTPPDHDHQWQDTGFATVEDCVVKGCKATRSDGVEVAALCLKEDSSGAFCTRPDGHEGLCE
jgi:hypothetical protein